MNIEHTIDQAFSNAAARYGEKAAFSGLGHTLSYREVEQFSDALASYLQHHTPLEPGDRVAIQLPNLLQYPMAIYGILRAGMVIVNTNPLYTEREMEHQLNDSGAKALLVLDAIVEKALQVAQNTSIKNIIVTGAMDLHTPLQDLTASEATIKSDAQSDIEVLSLSSALCLGREKPPIAVARNPEELAVLQYTGGTTGVAKGAMLSHRNLLSNAWQFTTFSKEHFKEGDEIYVTPLPLYHIYAFSVHCLGLTSAGGHNVLIHNPRDIPALVAEIRRHPFTGFVGINTLFNALCHNEEFRQIDFSHLRHSSAGGMTLSTEVAEQWKELTGVDIGEGYGMTETSPVICTNPPNKTQLGTVGLPMPETEVKLINSEGNPAAPGEAGELCVRGPQVMKGYWQRPEATAEVLSEEGWLRTGDVAEIQPDGFIRIVDRIKDMIVVSGFNVYPNEVEAVASSHPQVLECAAIGVADEKSGEAVKLFVVSESGKIDTEELRQFMRKDLTAYKVPSQIEQVTDLPKSNVGKILRKELR